MQFNQAIIQTYSVNQTCIYPCGSSTTTPAPVNETSFIVPVGKTWKVESAVGEVQGNTTWGIYNDTNFLLFSGGMNQPYWLPSGTYKIKVSCFNCNGPQKIAFNAIEFNITP